MTCNPYRQLFYIPFQMALGLDNGEELLKAKQVDALEILLIHRFERRKRMVPPEYRKAQPQSRREIGFIRYI